ncbi:MAG TPA: hypothetical protein DD728_04595 [Hyphomonas atlantica]|uniref:Uncharacterized protein n=1 Tax=Hyphomonas atlantica TaxID=1280948 RepID=A0A356W3K7_9PROT|nr:hypothetical protein [Rhodospirillaceae bacterium]HBQ48157.1 hypothetical protein [Hyphomonas atlantica]|tara:strand:+ start:371 stop:676 length:306 start_codon:yes stop_codon:yes gene_type:complete
MEPLNSVILDFKAFVKEGEEELAPFSLLVIKPGYEEGRGYFCSVICTYLRAKPFQIFGVDEAQACELSIDFIRQMLEGQAELVDADGNPVDLPEIVWDEQA